MGKEPVARVVSQFELGSAFASAVL